MAEMRLALPTFLYERHKVIFLPRFVWVGCAVSTSLRTCCRGAAQLRDRIVSRGRCVRAAMDLRSLAGLADLSGCRGGQPDERIIARGERVGFCLVHQGGQLGDGDRATNTGQEAADGDDNRGGQEAHPATPQGVFYSLGRRATVRTAIRRCFGRIPPKFCGWPSAPPKTRI
jgi:hypothetical protein